MKWAFAILVVVASARVASAQCPPCAESWQTPDANCYCSLYECKAGNPRCDVDVAGLAALACEQIITTSTAPTNDWSAIDWANRVICIEAGDHTGRGTLTLGSSGTADTRKVLRYVRSGDSDDQPWQQSAVNQALLAVLHVHGDFWVIHRLKVSSAQDELVVAGDGSGNGNDNIFSRVWVENREGWNVVFAGGSQRSTLQGSLMKSLGPLGVGDHPCVVADYAAKHNRVVSNEMHNCSDGVLLQLASQEDFAGTVIENNDIYLTSAYYSDGSGNLTPSGDYACAENGIDMKGGGTSSDPVRVVHNRIWGQRVTDGTCADGSYGESIVFHTFSGGFTDYGLVHDNILFDGTQAITTPNFTPSRWSIAGNLIYDMKGVSSGTYAIDVSADTTDVYLNTLIATNRSTAHHLSRGWVAWWSSGGDLRCNVVIDGGESQDGAQSGAEEGANVYYGTSGNLDEPSAISTPMSTRAGSTGYGAGAVVRATTDPVTQCAAPDDADCFLYAAAVGGTSGGSAPTWCTAPGCTVTDGSVTWQAIRGPYCFYRKLRTAPEQVCIPYATVHESAPEYGFCRAENMGGVPLGSRPGIGINDEVAPY